MFSLASSRRSGAEFLVDHDVRAPSRALSPFVQRAYTTRMPSESIGGFVFKRIPEACVHVYLLAETNPHDGSFTRATLRLQGSGDRLVEVKHAPRPVTMVGVELEIGVARQVLGVPASALFGHALSLEDLWARRADELVDKILSARTARGRGRVLAQTLLSRARVGAPPPKTITGALRAINRAQGHVRVADIATTVGVSARQLQRQFMEEVGCTPKRYARIARLRRLLLSHDAEGPRSWADRAADLGYADQAHLIMDFRNLMGASPERLLGRGDFVPEFVRDGWFLTPRVSDFHKTEGPTLP